MAGSRQKQDHGWSWVILFAAFMCNVTFDGIVFSFGIFYLEFLDHFKVGRGPTSWIGSVISGVYAIVGPLASVLANKYGYRKVTIAGSLLSATGFFLSTLSPNIGVMIFTYGIMGGVGFGLMYLCSYVMIGHYFERYRALATGIASCGSGVGTFVFAPLSVWLIQSYGWKGAMWIISGIVVNGVVMGALFRPPPELEVQNPENPPEKKKLIDFSLLREPTFMIFCFSSFLCLVGFFVPFIYIPDYARKHGLSNREGAFLISIIGITNTIGRVFCGYISDKPWADPLKIYNMSLIVGGTATIAVPWLTTYPLLVAYAAVFGLAVAAYVSLCAIILVEFLGLEKLSNSFGFINMFRGIATFIGAPVAGFLFDLTGHYAVAFWVAGASIAGAGLICIPLRTFRKCESTSARSGEPAITLSEEELENMAVQLKRAKELGVSMSSINLHAPLQASTYSLHRSQDIAGSHNSLYRRALVSSQQKIQSVLTKDDLMNPSYKPLGTESQSSERAVTVNIATV